MEVRLYLFDDGQARRWQPFRLTRPVGELLFGCLRLRERTERVIGARAAGYLAGSELAGFEEAGAPPVVEPEAVPTDAPRVFLSSRLVLEPSQPAARGRAATFRVGGQVVGWALPPGERSPSAEALLDPDAAGGGGPEVELRGRLLQWPWELVERNADRVARDVAALVGGAGGRAPEGVHVLGSHPLSLGEGASVEPGVLLDLREGPIHLDAGAQVQGPARLVGPLFVGERSTLFGGSIGKSSIGPVCKVRGEVDGSVLVGYANKAHDGYLGHALVGQWVNLGAFTTNSDLKNNYSGVRVRLGREEVDTGLLKVGCLLGDHVKTGIGTLLTTGAVVGAGSNVFGGRMPPAYVPPFSWGAGSELTEFRFDKFLEVATAAMGRRGVELTRGMRRLLERAWHATRAERL